MIETAFERPQMLDLAFRDFRVVIINMIKELNEIMFKKLKRDMMALSHQTDNVNKEIEII